MDLPTVEYIDLIRKNGFRPEAVSVCIFEKKVMFLFKAEYQLWGLSQGGIQVGEDLETALWREVKEELGSQFLEQSCSNKEFQFFMEDKITFPTEKQNKNELITEDGDVVWMRGKHYFFSLIHCIDTHIDMEESEFDNAIWVNYADAQDLLETIYQKGKKRQIGKVIEFLYKNNIIE